jgi:hypothetical protein
MAVLGEARSAVYSGLRRMAIKHPYFPPLLNDCPSKIEVWGTPAPFLGLLKPHAITDHQTTPTDWISKPKWQHQRQLRFPLRMLLFPVPPGLGSTCILDDKEPDLALRADKRWRL